MTNGTDYYDKHLSAEGLRRCYELAPPRVRQYLQAEMDFICAQTSRSDTTLELGCGFGRVLDRLAAVSDCAFGIDTAGSSLVLATKSKQHRQNAHYARMNADRLAFSDRSFDKVFCIQNGIAVFSVDPERTVAESLRVLKDKGQAFFSSYAGEFWEERLAWFRIQSRAGLLGEIDEDQTNKGEIVCKDGFHAKTMTIDDFKVLGHNLNVSMEFRVIDNSSLFCIMTRRG